ncbi:MAG: putative endonuclease 4 [Dehalococcoidia bacterium]|nr:putative endonuclease 4 [Dehalococcoidia bacterium]
MRIGAHVSAAGGISKAVDRAVDLGAETIQIFASAPQGWAHKPHTPQEIERFTSKAREAGVGPVFLHGVYLINLATDNLQNLAKSVDSLTFSLDVANKIGAAGVVFHVGSHKGVGLDAVIGQIRDSFLKALEGAPGEAWIIIENNAGSGQNLGATFAEVGRIMREVGSPRVKVCLDTAHCLASGYNVTTQSGLESAMEEFDREVGLESLVAVHANDSKVPLSSGVDRHENIGQGYIGISGFEVIMGHPAFRNVPFLLEVPGYDGKGPDKENLNTLFSIRQKLDIMP